MKIAFLLFLLVPALAFFWNNHYIFCIDSSFDFYNFFENPLGNLAFTPVNVVSLDIWITGDQSVILSCQCVTLAIRSGNFNHVLPRIYLRTCQL